MEPRRPPEHWRPLLGPKRHKLGETLPQREALATFITFNHLELSCRRSERTSGAGTFSGAILEFAFLRCRTCLIFHQDARLGPGRRRWRASKTALSSSLIDSISWLSPLVWPPVANHVATPGDNPTAVMDARRGLTWPFVVWRPAKGSSAEGSLQVKSDTTVASLHFVAFRWPRHGRRRGRRDSRRNHQTGAKFICGRRGQSNLWLSTSTRIITHGEFVIITTNY